MVGVVYYIFKGPVEWISHPFYETLISLFKTCSIFEKTASLLYQDAKWLPVMIDPYKLVDWETLLCD